MFNGKCKIWREGDKLHAVMNLQTPTGPLEWKDEVSADLDDASAHPRIVSKAKYVAGFFPTEEMVGSNAYSAAERLYDDAAKPETRDAALASIREIQNAAASGDEEACDVGYALDRIVASRAEVIGARILKKIGKKFKKAGKVAAGVAFPPYGAYQLAKAAKRNPAMVRKIKTIATIAAFPPAALALKMKSRTGKPASLAAAQEMQAKAQEALENIEQAEEIQEAAYEETGDYDAFAPASYSDDYSGDPGEPQDSEESEFIGLALYRDGATYEDTTEEEVSGLLSIAKAVGRKIDPSRPNSPYRSGLAAIPGIGPAIKSSLDLLDAAKKGQKEAMDKVKAIKDLSAAGVDKAKAAEKNLRTAQELSKKMEREVASELNPGKKTWFPGFNLYRDGARS